MKVNLAIDRFEGDAKDLAVLLTDAGVSVHFPRSLLPKGVKAGDILTFAIERDAGATRKTADETRKVQAELKKTDPGGDVQL